MKNLVKFEDFTAVNEKAAYRHLVSHEVQDHIKEMCEGMMHNEAKACHENDDDSQTYEAYCNEAENYMKNCLRESMQSYIDSAKKLGKDYLDKASYQIISPV
jgi:hypothetical protein